MKRGEILTFTGRLINVLNPNPEDIVIEDIAHGLSNTIRWGGHTLRPYTVAEHSCAVSLRVKPQLRLDALMHDAAEAYIGDMPAPIKMACPAYIDIEKNLIKVIYKKFGIPFDVNVDAIHYADMKQRDWEYNNLMLKDKHAPHSQRRSKERFLDFFHTYREYIEPNKTDHVWSWTLTPDSKKRIGHISRNGFWFADIITNTPGTGFYYKSRDNAPLCDEGKEQMNAMIAAFKNQPV